MTTPSETIALPLWLVIAVAVVIACALWSRFVRPSVGDWDFVTAPFTLFGWVVIILLGVITWLLMQ